MGDEKSPAFQFYPKDFLSSATVIRMTPMERGIYITLLSVSWVEGGLPDDVTQLAKLSGVPLKQFARVWPHNLAGCFSMAKNGRLVNERLEAEREKQRQFRERQIENGRRRGSPKAKPNEAKPDPSLTQASARALQTEDVDAIVVVPKEEKALDEHSAFRRLVEEYPQHRIDEGYLALTAFHEALHCEGDPPATFAAMLEGLANHVASHEWRVKGMAPGMLKWLNGRQWRRRYDEQPPAAERLSKSTNVTANAMAEILSRRPA